MSAAQAEAVSEKKLSLYEYLTKFNPDFKGFCHACS